MIENIRAVEKVLVKLQEVFVVATLSCLVIFQILQVFFRYVLSSPLGWVDETSRFILIWMVMIGSAYAAQKLAHFHVDFLVANFPKRISKLANAIVAALSIVFVGILIFSSIQYLLDMKGKVSAAMGVPIEVVNYAIPIGFTLLGIHLILNIILKNKEVEIPME